MNNTAHGKSRGLERAIPRDALETVNEDVELGKRAADCELMLDPSGEGTETNRVAKSEGSNRAEDGRSLIELGQAEEFGARHCGSSMPIRAGVNLPPKRTFQNKRPASTMVARFR